MALPDWSRELFREPGGKPFLFYVVYGSFGKLPTLSPAQYRSSGVPPGLKFQQYHRPDHAQVLDRFAQGLPWHELKKRNANLAKCVHEIDQCVVLRGQLDDCATLNYLRDAVGLVTFLLDHGGVAVYEPQLLHWWEPAEWRQRIFEPGEPLPTHHVRILTSEEATLGRSWLHTRGMRKFGRPDLSIRHVSLALHRAAIELCRRFIFFQAQGGVIDEGQIVTMKGLPDGLTCRHRGHLEDPDFYNVHVEIVLPQETGSAPLQ